MLQILALAASVAAIVVVIWLDVATGLWQNTVILSGIAAGLLTFALTALLLDRLIARADHQRWLPVTRLALTDLLHTMADEEASEISRGHITARGLTVPDPFTSDDAGELLAAVVTERREITEVLARWAGFLAASADVQDLMRHISQVATNLDVLRDDLVQFERTNNATDRQTVLRSIANYQNEVRLAITEIHALLNRD